MDKKLNKQSKEMPEAVEKILGELVELLEDKEASIRTNALFDLGVYAYNGLAIKSALPKLVERLDDEDESVRMNALAALSDYASLGLTDNSALPKLVKLLEDEDVWSAAASTLGDYASMGLTIESALPRLVKLLEDEDKKKDEDMYVNIEYALNEYAERGLKHRPSTNNRKTAKQKRKGM
nr:HEAT repeat domain-containing protein [Candidatus Freyarchaeota archaeon]